MVMVMANIVDKFLDRVEKEANKKIVYQRVYMRPSKVKSVIGFIVSLICFIVMIGLFSFTIFFWVLFLLNIVLLLFYAVNAFTEKGIALPKTIAVELPDEEEDSSEEEINYFPDSDDEDTDFENDNSFYDQEDYNEENGDDNERQ